MAEHTSTKLDPDAHLVLEQPLLRLPHELLKKNLKSAQRAIEPISKSTTTAIQSSTKQSAAETLASLDATLQKAQNLKRKLEALREEEKALHRQQQARIDHLRDLHETGSLADVSYDKWSRVRLDRLLVDYLLRNGYTAAAKALAKENGIEDLVDISVFDEAHDIVTELYHGSVKEALSWCNENKNALKKVGSELELELRLQQFVELVRDGEPGKLMEAVAHARKYLSGDGAAGKYGLWAGGLMAFGGGTFVEPYQVRCSLLPRLRTATHRYSKLTTTPRPSTPHPATQP
jgi:macrophage erythroblast attacher